MQEPWFQSLGQEDCLKKEMETHPSIFTWEIPKTEDSGELQSLGSQKNHIQLSDKITRTICHRIYLPQLLYTCICRCTSRNAACGSDKGTWNSLVIWPWRAVGFDYRTARQVRETDTPLSEGTNKVSHAPRPREKEHYSTGYWIRHTSKCLTVSCGGMGQVGLTTWMGALAEAVLEVLLGVSLLTGRH